MKTISTITQAKNAKAGVYSVKGAAGVTFRKSSDTPGAGAFNQRFRIGGKDGKRQTMSLGPLSKFPSLDVVRAVSQKVRDARDEGVNPLEAKRAKKAANLAAERAKKPVDFTQATEAYLAAHAPSWKHRYARVVWLNPVAKYAYPVIGALPLNDIGVEHIAAIMGAASKRGVAETGRRVRSRIEAVLNGCIALGQRDAKLGNPANAKLIAAVHPSRRKAGDRKHFRRIPLDDAPAVFRALREAQERAEGHRRVAFDAWLFMVATAARPSEALCAQWSEIDPGRKLWTLPAARAKTGRRHVSPLSSIALEVLERRALARTGANIFQSRAGSPIGYPTFAFAPLEAGIDAGTPHSWRSLFRDWAGDVGRIDRDLAEAQLAHSLGSTEASYRRESAVEARRPALETYAKWLVGESADIIQLRPSRA